MPQMVYLILINVHIQPGWIMSWSPLVNLKAFNIAVINCTMHVINLELLMPLNGGALILCRTQSHRWPRYAKFEVLRWASNPSNAISPAKIVSELCTTQHKHTQFNMWRWWFFFVGWSIDLYYYALCIISGSKRILPKKVRQWSKNWGTCCAKSLSSMALVPSNTAGKRLQGLCEIQPGEDHGPVPAPFQRVKGFLTLIGVICGSF